MGKKSKESGGAKLPFKLNIKVVIAICVGLAIVFFIGSMVKTELDKQKGAKPPDPAVSAIDVGYAEGEIPPVATDEEKLAGQYDKLPEGTIDEAVTKFLTMIKNKNFDLAYDMLYIPIESEFISRDDFDWYVMKSIIGRLKDADTSVKGIVCGVDGEVREINIKLLVGKKQEQFEMRARLNSENKWKMVLDDMYVYDWTLKAPKGVNLTYSTADITKYIKKSDSNIDTYVFPIVPMREMELTASSLFDEHTVEITPQTNVNPKKGVDTSQTLLIEISGDALADALDGALLVTNGLNSAMCAGKPIDTCKDLIDKRVILNNLAEMYKIGVRQRERYREAGGTTISEIIANPKEPSYVSGYDTVSLGIGMYMNMEDKSKGVVEMRLHTRLELSNVEDKWHYFGGDSKVLTYVNGSTKNF